MNDQGSEFLATSVPGKDSQWLARVSDAGWPWLLRLRRCVVHARVVVLSRAVFRESGR